MVMAVCSDEVLRVASACGTGGSHKRTHPIGAG